MCILLFVGRILACAWIVASWWQVCRSVVEIGGLSRHNGGIGDVGGIRVVGGSLF